MNFKLLLESLDVHDDYAETRAAEIVNDVSEWAAKNGHPSLVREWTPAAGPTEVRRYLAECIAATAEAAPESEWLDAEQAAEALGVGYRTVLELCKSGKLKSKKVGRQIRIRRADLGKVEQSDDRGRHFSP